MSGKLWTGRGDAGTTQLLYGGSDRVDKDALRPAAYGDADEAVAALGVARSLAVSEGEEHLAAVILRVQRELFALNAELATAPEHWDRLQDGVSKVTGGMVTALERDIEDLSARFEAPLDFIVPGNTRLGAALDLARTVVRRAERSAVTLARAEGVREEALRYLNRLSSLVWVMERYAERSERQPRPRDG